MINSYTIKSIHTFSLIMDFPFRFSFEAMTDNQKPDFAIWGLAVSYMYLDGALRGSIKCFQVSKVKNSDWNLCKWNIVVILVVLYYLWKREQKLLNEFSSFLVFEHWKLFFYEFSKSLNERFHWTFIGLWACCWWWKSQFSSLRNFHWFQIPKHSKKRKWFAFIHFKG